MAVLQHPGDHLHQPSCCCLAHVGACSLRIGPRRPICQASPPAHVYPISPARDASVRQCHHDDDCSHRGKRSPSSPRTHVPLEHDGGGIGTTLHMPSCWSGQSGRVDPQCLHGHARTLQASCTGHTIELTLLCISNRRLNGQPRVTKDDR